MLSLLDMAIALGHVEQQLGDRGNDCSLENKILELEDEVMKRAEGPLSTIGAGRWSQNSTLCNDGNRNTDARKKRLFNTHVGVVEIFGQAAQDSIIFGLPTLARTWVARAQKPLTS